ncbi:histidine kinase [Lysinibacter cavernae]|uniref:histidine kinase n=1 Tax=Lysinibacter cavernae TaxID=1640652 RepID=A0A7X5TT50_9MICO|nr:signal transduction histidine kinase [Lysinibacter cavernae]
MKRKLTFPLVAAADLAVDATIMAIVSTVLGTLISVGMSLIWVVGIGLVFLAACIFVVRFVAYEERQRAAAVYRLTIQEPPRVRTQKTGVAGFFHQLWVDVTQSSFWRAVLFIVVSSVLAAIGALLGLGAIGAGVGMLLGTAIRPDGDPLWFTAFAENWGNTDAALPGWVVPVSGIAAIAIGVAVTICYGLVDRALAPALLGPTQAALLRGDVSSLSEARESAVSAAAGDRMRVERDLHDGVQPRLVSVAMTLGMAKNKLESDPAEARELIDMAHSETKNAITELRQLARGIHPAVLTDRGLDAALSALVARCAVPSSLAVDLPERGTPEVEAVIYFSVAEALANIDKHSRASRCTVQVYRVADQVVAVVTDDGVGGAAVQDGLAGSGLAGIRDRVQSAGGEFRVASPQGGPTTLTVRVPWRKPESTTEVQ